MLFEKAKEKKQLVKVVISSNIEFKLNSFYSHEISMYNLYFYTFNRSDSSLLVYSGYTVFTTVLMTSMK